MMDKVLSIILIAAILGAVGTLGYIIATPHTGEDFTEFYILGPEGKAADYPSQLVMGQQGKVIVGIINREHEVASYRVEVIIDGVKNNEVKRIVLEHEEKWEGEISFTPQKTGKRQKVEFILYQDGQIEPYLEPLHLWIDVTE